MRVFQMYCLYSSRRGRLKLDLAGGAEAVVAVVVEVVRHAGHEGVLVHHSAASVSARQADMAITSSAPQRSPSGQWRSPTAETGIML